MTRSERLLWETRRQMLRMELSLVDAKLAEDERPESQQNGDPVPVRPSGRVISDTARERARRGLARAGLDVNGKKAG